MPQVTRCHDLWVQLTRKTCTERKNIHLYTCISENIGWAEYIGCPIANIANIKQEAQLLLGDRVTRKHAKDSWNGRGNDNLGWNDLQMYSKVIKGGTNRKLVYDFLLVVYSNFCRITHRFWEMWCETEQWPWNMPKVSDSRITWKLSCGHVCKMFGRQWPNEPKIAIFYDPTLMWRPLSSEPPRISA